MSLISRIEVSNYLTEGLADTRRIANWKPLISAVTLRMDCKSTLINITNGGGKTSIADIILYALSRDSRLLKRVRDKCSPKERGYTHARVEFRDSSEESYVARDLLEPDPMNMPGETHVVGIVLNDRADEQPIFYTYSGTLEDSPCYEMKGGVVTLIPDTEFVNKTRTLRGCKWNKHASKREWEDQIALFVSTDVVRRNVKYQIEGSDDRNAEFFAFKTRGGESYASAFFRHVVAPDLLTNILSTWSEENEQSIEDTLYLSLSQIVKTDDDIAKKQRILEKREAQMHGLEPLLAQAQTVTQSKQAVEAALQRFRKDAALAEHFGAQGERSALPGIPRSPEAVLREARQDPRILPALKGMFLSADGPTMILDKTLANLAKVEVSKLNEAAQRKGIRGQVPGTQVIDFACDLVNMNTGHQGGGHARKGYTREAALQVPSLVQGMANAEVAGLRDALEMAFDIADAQIDTNPASISLRALDNDIAAAKASIRHRSMSCRALPRR